MADVAIPHDIANSPVGKRLAWLVNRVRESGSALTDAEIESNFVNDLSAERIRIALGGDLTPLVGFDLCSVRSPGPQIAIAALELDGDTWDVGIRVEPHAPHRIRSFNQAKRVPGVTVRVATDADAAILREIELTTPLVLGDTRVVYDRGEDYFAAERLMGNVVTHIVELNGRPVGLTSWVTHEICVRGARLLGGYKHRTRLLPDARGQGMREMLDFAGFEAIERDVMYTFAAAANEAVIRAYGVPRWIVRPEKIVVDAKGNAGAPAGRPASAADSARIVDLLNRAHTDEELFVPYTAETLTARLVREPAMYSWPNLRLGERAVVGVWAAHLNVLRTSGTESTTDDRALVLDYGYEEGADGELADLLKAECSVLSQSGTTELALFMTPQSSAHAQLSALAKRIEPYLMWLAVPPPDDLASRGIYVDQLYF